MAADMRGEKADRHGQWRSTPWAIGCRFAHDENCGVVRSCIGIRRLNESMRGQAKFVIGANICPLFVDIQRGNSLKTPR